MLPMSGLYSSNFFVFSTQRFDARNVLYHLFNIWIDNVEVDTVMSDVTATRNALKADGFCDLLTIRRNGLTHITVQDDKVLFE